MTEQECLAKMVAPGAKRRGKWLGGILQIMVTRACDRQCYGCTQNSQLGGKSVYITPEQFETACQSLEGYWGVVGMFGGNPCLHPQFDTLCGILRSRFPQEQCGLWSNRIFHWGEVCRKTFNPGCSNLNVHQSQAAWDEMIAGWPECKPYLEQRFKRGLTHDSRHSPPFVAMKDVLRKPCPEYLKDKEAGLGHGAECKKCGGTRLVYDEEKAWDLISNCDINQHWSALIGVVPGRGLRAYFCEIAYSQAVLHADDPSWPDVGLDLSVDHEVLVSPGERVERTLCKWWQLGMGHFAQQVRQHCHNCSVPIRGYGELANAKNGKEQVSQTHAPFFNTKEKGRQVELVTDLVQLGVGKLSKMTLYLENSKL